MIRFILHYFLYGIHRVLWAGLGWFFLSGQSWRGRRIENKISLDNIFVNQSTPSQIPTSFWVFLTIVTMIALSAVIFMHLQRKQRTEDQFAKIAEEKANMQLEMKLSKMNLDKASKALVEKIVDSSSARDILPMVQSVEFFEEKVKEYKKTHKDSEVFKQILTLRQKLGYEFGNRTVPFICTQMLAPDLKLECRIPHPEKRIMFMTPILDIGETRILIKPPTVKGKAANMKRFPKLIFKIRRDADAEYEFTLPVVNQVSGKMDAVVLGHTTEITKLFIRESERIALNLRTSFSLIPESELDNAEEDGQLEEDIPFEGNITDMSAGGLKIVAGNLSIQMKTGGFIVFHLEGANLRENLIVQIARVSTDQRKTIINCQFIRMRDLTRMKINKFLHRLKKQNSAQTIKQKSKSKPAAVSSAQPQTSSPKPVVQQDRQAAALKKEEREAILGR